MPAGLIQGPQTNGDHFGVGLSGMRERVNDLDGNFEIQAGGDGTAITVPIPLASETSDAAKLRPEEVGCVATRAAHGAQENCDELRDLPRCCLHRLCTYAAMCAFGIDELRQHPAEVLLLGWHAEQDSFGAHVPVKSLDIGDCEPQFDLSSRALFGSRVQRESGFARHEFTPTR